MALAIGGVLAALCLLVAGLPFLRRRVAAPYPVDPVLELQRRREAVYREIQTLQHDYTLGDVPQAEYEERLQSHRLLMATLLREQERLQELDQRLEEEILRLGDSADASSDETPCPECGQQVDRAAEQCPSCGTVLSRTASDG